MLNEDYKDILRAFADENVKFLLVGAYAMSVHGHLRATMDIDLWIEPSVENAEAVLRALGRFGAPIGELTVDDLVADDNVFQIGVAPRRIDILTGATGLAFHNADSHARSINIDGLDIRVLSLDDLIRNKKAAGRKQDIADVEVLESLRESKPDDRTESS